MLCGGTNFGFMNGALFGKYRADVPGAPDRYVPYGTSYDVDAPVNEYGQPTQKYYELKKILCEHLGTEYVENKCDHKLNSFGKVKLEKTARCMCKNTKNWTKPFRFYPFDSEIAMPTRSEKLSFGIGSTWKATKIPIMKGL